MANATQQNGQTLMERVIRLRGQYLTDRQFTLILSFLEGPSAMSLFTISS